MRRSIPAGSTLAFLAALALLILAAGAVLVAARLPGAGPGVAAGDGIAPGCLPPTSLVSYRTNMAPAIAGAWNGSGTGQLDDAWSRAPALTVTMTHGMGSPDRVWDMQMRSLHTDSDIYFLAQWSGEPPAARGDNVPGDTLLNIATVHWTIPHVDSGLQPLSCDVACHTAYGDAGGRFVSAGTVTIPQGGPETLKAGGGWTDGTWTLAWGRPLASTNPYDVQFTDLSRRYEFFVKVFERVDGRADPISRNHILVFQP